MRLIDREEAVALITSEVIELIRDGKSAAQVTGIGPTILPRDSVMEGMSEMIGEVQVEDTFPDGTKLVTIHQPSSNCRGSPAKSLSVFAVCEQLVRSVLALVRGNGAAMWNSHSGIILAEDRPPGIRRDPKDPRLERMLEQVVRSNQAFWTPDLANDPRLVSPARNGSGRARRGSRGARRSGTHPRDPSWPLGRRRGHRTVLRGSRCRAGAGSR